jgi:hypothetical protein
MGRVGATGRCGIAPDGFVFVAEYGNSRVQVLTPSLRLDFGVVANADVVVVSEFLAHRLTVLDRSDGALVRRIGAFGLS